MKKKCSMHDKVDKKTILQKSWLERWLSGWYIREREIDDDIGINPWPVLFHIHVHTCAHIHTPHTQTHCMFWLLRIITITGGSLADNTAYWKNIVLLVITWYFHLHTMEGSTRNHFNDKIIVLLNMEFWTCCSQGWLIQDSCCWTLKYSLFCLCQL